MLFTLKCKESFAFRVYRIGKNMSVGRKRLSGAAYRKAALEEVVKKTAKIFNCFQKPEYTSSTSNKSDRTKNCRQGKGDESEPIKRSDTTDFVNDLDIEITAPEDRGYYSEDSKTGCSTFVTQGNNHISSDLIPHTNLNNPKNVVIEDIAFVFDPAVWSINENTREQIIEHGTNQDISKLDFSRSKRFVGGQHRFLTQSLFQTKLVNG